jgi:hypothetical protein
VSAVRKTCVVSQCARAAFPGYLREVSCKDTRGPGAIRRVDELQLGEVPKIGNERARAHDGQQAPNIRFSNVKLDVKMLVELHKGSETARWAGHQPGRRLGGECELPQGEPNWHCRPGRVVPRAGDRIFGTPGCFAPATRTLAAVDARVVFVAQTLA